MFGLFGYSKFVKQIREIILVAFYIRRDGYEDIVDIGAILLNEAKKLLMDLYSKRIDSGRAAIITVQYFVDQISLNHFEDQPKICELILLVGLDYMGLSAEATQTPAPGNNFLGNYHLTWFCAANSYKENGGSNPKILSIISDLNDIYEGIE